MGSSSLLIFCAYLILTCLCTLTFAQETLLVNSCANNAGNYTANSTYSTNLNRLRSSLSSITENDYGFYNMSVGQNTDIVNAIALCRGDVKPDVCVSCINNASIELTNRCPNQKEAIIWYDNCMFRYSNRSIFGTMETGHFYMWNGNNVTDPDVFNKTLSTLLDNLRSRAASGDSQRKYATGNATATAFQTIFALVQCTPDLSEQECNDCLDQKFAEIPNCCEGKQRLRIIGPSCIFRYDMSRFYEPVADIQPAAAPPTSPPLSPPQVPAPSNETTTAKGKDGNNTSRTVIFIAVPTVAVVILIISICICIFLRVTKRKPKKKLETVEEIRSADSLQYDFVTIRNATNNFSDANKLGQGGFGAVYQGKLSDGQEIAVKRLSRDSGQGDIEFKNEVLLVAKLQHRNLVRLLGFCLEGSERVLIYEFVPNASLDHFIFDSIKRTHIDWERRCKIIGGIARGLLYLHEDSRLRIIHRDLKASNILLDAEMNPKIADFGIARLFTMDQTQGETSRIVGTYGYMAPEYVMHGNFSVKSDVFGFGVLVLEIISGQKNNCFRNRENVKDLLSYAWRSWREGMALNVVDPCLASGSRTEMMRCIHIGLLCVQENVANRPTMASIVLMLNSYSLTLPIPSKPAFFMHSTIESDMTESNGSIIETVPLSANEASITELYPR